MSEYEELQKEIKLQAERIRLDNERWKKNLAELHRAYWKNPKIRGAILDATESIKHTEY